MGKQWKCVQAPTHTHTHTHTHTLTHSHTTYTHMLMNTHTHTHNDSLHLSINHDPNSGAESISFLHVVCGENSASVLALKAAADHIPVKQRPPGKLSPQAKAKFSHSQILPQWWEQLFSWPTPTSPLNLCTLHWIVKLRGSSSFRAALKTHLFNNFILFRSHAYPCLTCVCVCVCVCACVCVCTRALSVFL